MKKTNEKWNDIKGFEGYYQVSNTGRVKSLDRDVKCTSKLGNEFISHKEGRILKPTPNGNGYLSVVLAKDGETRTSPIHRLVAEAFLENPNNYNTVHHKNGNHQDNRAENLIWMEGEEHNRIHGFAPKTVYVYTKDLQLLLTFNSTKEAARELGISQGNIVNCCLGSLPHYHNLYFSYVPMDIKAKEQLDKQGEEKKQRRLQAVKKATAKWQKTHKEKYLQKARDQYYKKMYGMNEHEYKIKKLQDGNMERHTRL